MQFEHSRQSVANKVFVALFVSVLVIYKLWIIFYYNVHYVDVDQAIMWYGTAVFAHGRFPEPGFFGQAYNAMVESLLAVPLYWLKVPLSVALPLVTSVFLILPVIMIVSRSKSGLETILAISSCLMMSWEMDILLSVPRSFATGISISTAACFVLIRTRKKFVMFLCAAFAVLGALITNTALIILAVTGVYILWRDKIVVRHFVCYFLGAVFGGLYLVVREIFYYFNSDYRLHEALSMEWSFQLLRWAKHEMYDVFGKMNVFGIGILTLGVLVLIGAFLIKNKLWGTFLGGLVGTMGVILLFGLTKTKDYDESLMFGQLRMFLILPYIFWLVLYMAGDEIKAPLRQGKNMFALKTLLLAAVLFCAIYKGNGIAAELREGTALTTSERVDLINADQTIEPIEEVLNRAEQDGVQWILTMTYTNTEAYILGARGYGKYHFYTASYDRRTWEYRKANELCDNVLCLCVYFNGEDGSIMKMETVNLQGESIVQYIERTVGARRK